MKKFSDLLDIDPAPTVLIHLRLSAVCHNGNPRCRVTINHIVVSDGEIANDINIYHRVALIDSIQCEIYMYDKKYSSDKETAVIIQHLSIDGFDIVPSWTQLANYSNDHGVNDPTSYLGFNGTWTLNIHEPFYIWRHKITGQGWLLYPTIVSRDSVPNSSSTIAN
jgi:hypothetical protein